MKILWAMYSSPGMFVVRADSPCRTIQDLKGRTVARARAAQGAARAREAPGRRQREHGGEHLECAGGPGRAASGVVRYLREAGIAR